MIELLSPQKISKEKILINELKSFGLDYLDLNSTLGWNYVLDHIWLYRNIRNYLQSQKLSNPVILDVGCGNSPFHNFVEDKLCVNIWGIDRPEGFCHQEELINTDYFVEFLKLKDFEENSVDILYWLSAIEHNGIESIRDLYTKSLYFLKPGGLLLITFPISRKTYWFKDSQQTNLSIEDAVRIFDDNDIEGNFDNIWQEFRDNNLSLIDKYKKRYKHFSKEDPEFIVGGLNQIKS